MAGVAGFVGVTASRQGPMNKTERGSAQSVIQADLKEVQTEHAYWETTAPDTHPVYPLEVRVSRRQSQCGGGVLFYVVLCVMGRPFTVDWFRQRGRKGRQPLTNMVDESTYSCRCDIALIQEHIRGMICTLEIRCRRYDG